MNKSLTINSIPNKEGKKGSYMEIFLERKYTTSCNYRQICAARVSFEYGGF